MMMNSQLSIPGYKPLVSCEEGVILFRRGRIYLWKNGILCEHMTLFPWSWKDFSRLSVRLFRREPRQAIAVDKDLLLIAGLHTVYLVDIRHKTCKSVFRVGLGFSDPLNLLATDGKWLALWGDYGSNPSHNPVGIYGLKSDHTVEKVYSFPSGTVRHVHNIIQKRQGGYYIFTGDMESSAGIYETDDSFSEVCPVVVGEQKHRAVVGMDFPQGLVYGTDTANEQNYLFLMQGKKQHIIAALNGPCVYGRPWNGGLLFSTTVEPDESVRGVASFFTDKLGKGILSKEVHLLFLDKELDLHTLGIFRKDAWPMKLMQYGCIQFVSGSELWIYPVAVQKNDGCAIWCKMRGTIEREHFDSDK